MIIMFSIEIHQTSSRQSACASIAWTKTETATTQNIEYFLSWLLDILEWKTGREYSMLNLVLVAFVNCQTNCAKTFLTLNKA